MLIPSKLGITTYFRKSLIKISTSDKHKVEIDIRVQTEPVEPKVNLILVLHKNFYVIFKAAFQSPSENFMSDTRIDDYTKDCGPGEV